MYTLNAETRGVRFTAALAAADAGPAGRIEQQHCAQHNQHRRLVGSVGRPIL